MTQASNLYRSVFDRYLRQNEDMAHPSSRMLKLLSLLQGRNIWSGSELADRTGVSPRTVRRDIERLRDLGYEIASVRGSEGGYRMAAGAQLPPLLFDDDQAVALTIALQRATATGIDIDEGARRALATLQQVLPSHLKHRVGNFTLASQPRTPHSQSHTMSVQVSPDVIEAVNIAIQKRLILRFAYGDTDSQRRVVEPHGLVERGRRWYLVAWESDRDRWSIFRLDRMTLRTHTGPRFTMRSIPTGGVESFVETRFKGSEFKNQWPCLGEFEIDLPLRDVEGWVKDGYAESIDEHTTRIYIGSWSWNALLAAIIQFDSGFRIVGPHELTSAARTIVERLQATGT